MSDLDAVGRARVVTALRRWNPWWVGGPFLPPGLVRRERFDQAWSWLGRIPVLAISGMRRSGKSTLMRQLIDGLVREDDANRRAVLFVHFEDPAFLELGTDTALLDTLFDAYLSECHPARKPWIFLDEVQNVAGWARWVRATHERGAANFVVSGSSSRMIEPELASVLTGRHITLTVAPFSLAEFLALGGGPGGQDASTPDELRLVEYLEFGGVPEAARLPAKDRPALLQQLFRDVIYRDVVQRHAVRDSHKLEQIAYWLLTNTAQLASFNKIAQRYGTGIDTVRDYAAHLEESYLLRLVPRLLVKPHERDRSPRKVFAVDVGLRNAVCTRFSEDLGHLAETLVHGSLRADDGAEVFYFQGEGQCDFVVRRGFRSEYAVQVCFAPPRAPLPPREAAGLIEALDASGATLGYIVSRRGEADVLDAGPSDARIVHVSLLDWLLRGPPHRRGALT